MKTDYPKPDHPLFVSEIVRAIRGHPGDIESCNECGDNKADPQLDFGMDQYVWVWPIHALISNDGTLLRGAGWPQKDVDGFPVYTHYLGFFAAWRIRWAISRWRRNRASRDE